MTRRPNEPAQTPPSSLGDEIAPEILRIIEGLARMNARQDYAAYLAQEAQRDAA